MRIITVSMFSHLIELLSHPSAHFLPLRILWIVSSWSQSDVVQCSACLHCSLLVRLERLDELDEGSVVALNSSLFSLSLITQVLTLNTYLKMYLHT